MKKLRAQEQPKSLPSDAFPGLQIRQNCFCGRGPRWGSLLRSPRPHSWIKGGLLLRGGEGRGKEGRGGEGRGRRGEGEVAPPPLSQIPGSAPDKVHHCYIPHTVYCCLVAGQLYPSCRFSSADCRCFQVSNPCQAIHSTAFVYHAALKDIDF